MRLCLLGRVIVTDRFQDLTQDDNGWLEHLRQPRPGGYKGSLSVMGVIGYRLSIPPELKDRCQRTRRPVNIGRGGGFF